MLSSLHFNVGLEIGVAHVSRVYEIRIYVVCPPLKDVRSKKKGVCDNSSSIYKISVRDLGYIKPRDPKRIFN